MKVIELHPDNAKKLEEFLPSIAEGKTRPAIYIGFDDSGSPVLHLAKMTWEELAHIKVAFEMHVIRDWLGLIE